MPGLSLVVSGDAVYNQTHMWLSRFTPTPAPAGCGPWIPWPDWGRHGHRNPLAADDDARRQIGDCRRYIADFETALARSSAPAELIDQMTAAYPDFANPYTLWVAAYDLLGAKA